jgi:hypothetical protein
MQRLLCSQTPLLWSKENATSVTEQATVCDLIQLSSDFLNEVYAPDFEGVVWEANAAPNFSLELEW